MAAAVRDVGHVVYGESSRKYRRTIFTYSDWVGHRANTGILRTLRGIFMSGIIRQLLRNAAVATLSAVVVVLWNAAAVQLPGRAAAVLPRLSLPMAPFTMSSSALSLLLVFRTNASYGRWNEARQTWGKIVVHSRNLVRMSATLTAGKLAEDSESSAAPALEALMRDSWLFARSTMNGLSGPDDNLQFLAELQVALRDSPNLLAQFLCAPDRATASLIQLSLSLDRIPVAEKPRLEMDKSIIVLSDCLGSCERIFDSPVPLVYTRHLSRFLSLWLLLLPLSMYDAFASAAAASYRGGAPWWCPAGAALIPATMLVSLFLFGIEQLSLQLEEPFSILPMQTFCDNIRTSNTRMRDWVLDSGRDGFWA